MSKMGLLLYLRTSLEAIKEIYKVFFSSLFTLGWSYRVMELWEYDFSLLNFQAADRL